jgi:hypothetical protein
MSLALENSRIDVEEAALDGVVPLELALKLDSMPLGDVYEKIEKFEDSKTTCRGPKAIRSTWLEKLHLVEPSGYTCQNPNNPLL